mgnify:CR=1 FL=1
MRQSDESEIYHKMKSALYGRLGVVALECIAAELKRDNDNAQRAAETDLQGALGSLTTRFSRANHRCTPG